MVSNSNAVIFLLYFTIEFHVDSNAVKKYIHTQIYSMCIYTHTYGLYVITNPLKFV